MTLLEQAYLFKWFSGQSFGWIGTCPLYCRADNNSKISLSVIGRFQIGDKWVNAKKGQEKKKDQGTKCGSC